LTRAINSLVAAVVLAALLLVGALLYINGAQALAAPSPKPSHHTRFPFLDGKGGRSCQRNVPNGLTS